MLTFLLLLIGAGWVAGAVVAVVLTFWLVALAVVALGLLALVRGVTGRWPSGKSVAVGAGLSLTLGLYVLVPSVYVLVGGVIGTALAGRGAALDDP